MASFLLNFPNFLAAWERTQMNMLEQMPPFLITMWLFSIFVEPVWGAILGLVYTVMRLFYPCFYPPPKVFVITLPNYVIIFFYMVCIMISSVIMIVDEFIPQTNGTDM
eukprot:TRINITY_DN667_c0_g1_i2.p1 TRINITY_DN667_c0_g1~~TRINITY_DN667_c0_g1_i2.p1  ORF type:complete len:108 (+),score=6.83 TRINITY_DN667_c0_g1_i2:388-711(+)